MPAYDCLFSGLLYTAMQTSKNVIKDVLKVHKMKGKERPVFLFADINYA